MLTRGGFHCGHFERGNNGVLCLACPHYTVPLQQLLQKASRQTSTHGSQTIDAPQSAFGFSQTATVGLDVSRCRWNTTKKSITRLWLMQAFFFSVIFQSVSLQLSVCLQKTKEENWSWSYLTGGLVSLLHKKWIFHRMYFPCTMFRSVLFSSLPGRHKEAEDWVWPIKDIMVLVQEY